MLIIVATWLLFQVFQISLRRSQMAHEVKRLSQEVARLDEERRRIEELQSYLSSDFFAEREARIRFGMQAKNEHAVVLESPQRALSQTESSEPRSSHLSNKGTPEQKKEQGNAWWSYFFGTLDRSLEK